MSAPCRIAPDRSTPPTYEGVCVTPLVPDGPACGHSSGELRSADAVDAWIAAHAGVTAHAHYRRGPREPVTAG
ncbi:hypothetical protein GXW83_07070 [Streptacidiphilus sp. PB12-B1b]|uniref:DUF7848 domain-containing protein n=1 Tax=Streptacidiphilus sp. PB12-B1b TaxID=2705012 RepID=UPI0015FBD9EB|nr:hypothetical protein [Streptacidiphilus sp. PB12-B1b]QMU75535.1 hypothetical protein GXW83_07070 [Streptacidiphilus sp. PB12-B1b]